MDSPDKILHLAGINTSGPADADIITLAKDAVGEDGGEFVCEICCDDDPEMEIVGLVCGHKFCKTCYVYYTSQKIKENENKPIQCPQDGCNITLDERVISLLVEPEVNSR